MELKQEFYKFSLIYKKLNRQLNYKDNSEENTKKEKILKEFNSDLKHLNKIILQDKILFTISILLFNIYMNFIVYDYYTNITKNNLILIIPDQYLSNFLVSIITLISILVSVLTIFLLKSLDQEGKQKIAEINRYFFSGFIFIIIVMFFALLAFPIVYGIQYSNPTFQIAIKHTLFFGLLSNLLYGMIWIILGIRKAYLKSIEINTMTDT